MPYFILYTIAEFSSMNIFESKSLNLQIVTFSIDMFSSRGAKKRKGKGKKETKGTGVDKMVGRGVSFPDNGSIVVVPCFSSTGANNIRRKND